MKKIRRLVGVISSSFYLLFSNVALALAQGKPLDTPVDVKPGIAPEVSIAGFVKAVINLLFVVAAVIAIIFLIWGGIRWIISGGDKTAVESARNTIIAAIIGLVIVVLAFFILSVVFQFLGINLFTNFRIPTVTQPGLDAR